MTAPNFEAVALEWLVQHLGYPRKGLETELAKLLQKVCDDAMREAESVIVDTIELEAEDYQSFEWGPVQSALKKLGKK